MQFDYIVVGAGTAGCVVAARLSEKPDRRVLLIEAGPDIVPEPESIRNPYPVSHGVAAFRWSGLATIKAPLDGTAQRGPFLQGRVVGGGGSLMGMIALRGFPADYDAWRDAGAVGWGWEDVLADFRRLEQDLDFDGPLHGGAGPIPVRRHPHARWSAFAKAVGAAFEADGFNVVADANGAPADGHLAVPNSNVAARRMSSAAGYLTADVRARPNLSILAGAEVDEILFTGGRASGVSVMTRAGRVSHAAHEIILCAGAIRSPHLLHRSGIGEAGELRRFGIAPRHDLPGVGRNLANHPAIYLSAFLPRPLREADGPFIYNALRYSSGLPGGDAHDMLMPVINRTGWHALGRAVPALGACVYQPLSRGRVAIERSGGAIAPAIDLGLFADARDLVRLVDGFRRIFRYLTAASASLPGLRVFAPTNVGLTAKLAAPGPRNRALAAFLAAITGGPLQPLALRRAGLDPTGLMRDDGELTRFVHRHAGPMFHPTGTCRIGVAADPAAVVDSRCRVHGVGGLRVVDASVMPSIVRANTNLPTIMIGEKAAAMICADATAGG